MHLESCTVILTLSDLFPSLQAVSVAYRQRFSMILPTQVRAFERSFRPSQKSVRIIVFFAFYITTEIACNSPLMHTGIRRSLCISDNISFFRSTLCIQCILFFNSPQAVCNQHIQTLLFTFGKELFYFSCRAGCKAEISLIRITSL